MTGYINWFECIVCYMFDICLNFPVNSTHDANFDVCISIGFNFCSFYLSHFCFFFFFSSLLAQSLQRKCKSIICFSSHEKKNINENFRKCLNSKDCRNFIAISTISTYLFVCLYFNFQVDALNYGYRLGIKIILWNMCTFNDSK